eukprot:gene3506-13577_t
MDDPDQELDIPLGKRMKPKSSRVGSSATSSSDMKGSSATSSRDMKGSLATSSSDMEGSSATSSTARVVNRLCEMKLLDDAAYAEVYVRSKWNQQRKAPGLIKQELVKLKVDQGNISAALDAFFGDAQKGVTARMVRDRRLGEEEKEEGGEEEDEYIDPAQAAAEQLVVSAQSRLRTMQSVGPEAQKRRTISWILRRGHSLDVAFQVIRELGL